MDIVNDLLFWLHLSSLALTGAAAFGLPVVGSRMPTATPEMRPTLFKIMHGLSTVGRTGIGILIVTGPLMLWLKYGWVAPNEWFWIKMVLLIGLLAGIIYGGILLKRSEGGDMASAKLSPQVGRVNMLLFLGIVLSAVLSFQ